VDNTTTTIISTTEEKKSSERTSYKYDYHSIAMTIQEPLWILGYGSLIFKPPPHASTPIPGSIKGYIRRFWQSSSDHRGTPERKGRVATLVPYSEVIRDEEIQRSVALYEGTRSEVEDVQEESDLAVQCCVYYIAPEHAAEVRDYLDIREQDGYTLHTVSFLIDQDLTSSEAYHSKHHQHLRPDSKLAPAVQKELSQLPINSEGKKVLKCQVYIGTTLNESFVGPERASVTARVIASSRGPSGENTEYLRELVYALRLLGEEDPYLEELLREVEAANHHP
jgi:cation transport protein ChaC